MLLYDRNAEGMVIAHPLLPEHRQMERMVMIQQLNIFNKEQKGQFEKYIRVLSKITHR